MKQNISVLTLGVDHLEKSLNFYQNAFGWSTPGIIGTEFEHGAVVFFELVGGMKLALFERANLAWDSGLPPGAAGTAGFSLGHNVSSEQEVLEIMETVRKHGATIIKPGQKTFWGGFAGYFTDIDGHLWEIAYNPAFQ
jgi:uncharacterized glyoxalase superfamily protein PhnB